MTKTFGVKSPDWVKFNKNLVNKCAELQDLGGEIKDIKYSNVCIHPGEVMYSAIIIYEYKS